MRIIANLLVVTILMAAYTINVQAQVSNDNEDEVYKVERPQAKDFVPGQVLFKLKDGQQAKVRRAAGRVQSAGISSLDKVLKEYAVQEMEQLLPNAKVTGTPRRAKAFNGDAIVERDLTQLYKVALPEEQSDRTMELVEQLQSLDEVEFAEPNYKLYIMADDHIADSYSSNPMVGQQWYLDAYGVKELWDKPMINKTRPVIAIIDTGVDITHPDLKDNIWTNQAEVDGRDDYDNDRNGFKNDIHGWDFINNTPKMRDNNKHGTHVAGIAAAANNGVGIVGANPQAWIMPITVMQSDGTGDVATIVKGIDYAVQNGATVLNLSLGSYANSNALRQALEKAYQSAVIVAAAGNDGRCLYSSHYPYPHEDIFPMACYPAAYSFVLGVQATTLGGGLAGFSNYDDDGALFSCESTIADPDGFNYEIKAPGTSILSTIPGGQYKEMNGTSMAAPLVAGSISALQMVKQYDTQEILWGDLLHTQNIAQAYNVEKRPAELDIMKVMLRNRKELADVTEEDNNSNNEVNVGETISIYPVIRSSFGKASNIKLKLNASIGQILNGEADFGYSLDAFGKAVSKNPLIMKVPDDMPNASEIIITIQVICDENSHLFKESFSMKVNNLWTLKGLQTKDLALTANHVYYVSNTLAIDEGTTLSIEPGTHIEFAEGVGMAVFGKLIAKGTPDHPIVFTSHNKDEKWGGLVVHGNVLGSMYSYMYTNNDQTKFTFLKTNVTPRPFYGKSKFFYYSEDEYNPTKQFSLGDYTEKVADEGWALFVKCEPEELTDPDFITPAMLDMIQDLENYYSQYPTEETEDNKLSAYASININKWYPCENPMDTISYCFIDGCRLSAFSSLTPPVLSDCFYKSYGSDAPITYGKGGQYKNTVNVVGLITPYCYLGKENYFNNYGIRNGKRYYIEVGENKLVNNPPYLGTSREDIIRPFIWDKGNDIGALDVLDIRNMRKEPVSEAHGIVWKVLIDEKDVQDEQEDLLPLGVGKHKFEVYFNRPMNKEIAPMISFGLREPYTQQTVVEDGNWNAEGTIYTAYKTIVGTTKSNGINRIYVRGAEDDEFFPCPYEATRFNFIVQTAGSLASGFQADAGLGSVKLKWNNENNDFEDAMGFNLYRYTEGENGMNDTIRINETTLDISATSYIDDQVIPGQTYYYYYKVLSTALQEYDVSNVVAATPLTATRGDANGSGEVDVADVITTVNYVTGLQPKPFVFDAADMNSDQLIDIFDVVGIVRGILDPSLLAVSSVNEESATYSVENGVLYVDSPVALAGIQVQLSLSEELKMKNEEFATAADLDGFETASAWLSDNDYLFLAYSLNGKTLAPGKHPLLYIGDAEVTSLRLSDAQGKNVNVSNGETTGFDRMGSHVMNVNGVYDLQGRKLSSNTPLKNGIYIINGKKVVK